MAPTATGDPVLGEDAFVAALRGHSHKYWGERHLAPGVRFAVDAYVTFARTRPWVDAVERAGAKP